MPSLDLRLGLVAGLVLASSLTSACQPAEAKSSLVASDPDDVAGFWWSHVGQQSLVVMNFGPWIESSAGTLRRWSMVVHAPGAEFGVLQNQGLQYPEDMAPILVSNDQYEIDVRPAPELTWGDVSQPHQLASEVWGLH